MAPVRTDTIVDLWWVGDCDAIDVGDVTNSADLSSIDKAVVGLIEGVLHRS